jgi:hypothetical protein
MIELILTLLPMLGSAGAGSLLKMLGGIAQEVMAARSLERKEKMALILQSRAADLDFQKSVFGSNNEDSKSALFTRRILAILGMSTFCVIAILCTLFPASPLVTFAPQKASGGGTVSLLFGLVSFPKSASVVTTTVTTGHLALMSANALVMIMAFYFTPGGRK